MILPSTNLSYYEIIFLIVLLLRIWIFESLKEKEIIKLGIDLFINLN